jgi:hypothetical protein
MAGVALTVATLVACALLLLLVRVELQAQAPTVHYDDDAAEDMPLHAWKQMLPPPPPALTAVEPICQVTFGKAECARGGLPIACPAQVDQVRHDTPATESGAWLLAPTYTYFLDRGLAAELTKLFAGASVTELGAGKGCYAAELRRSPPRHPGESRIAVRAFDGAPNVASITGGLVQRLAPSEWVLCLETAEHIPRQHEEQLLGNIHELNTVGVVLSWSNNAGGNGHVNLRTGDWVVRRFERMGYLHDTEAQHALRQAVSSIHWFRDTLMVFRRAPKSGRRTTLRG